MQTIKKVFVVLLAPIVFYTACTAGENMNIKGQLLYTDGGSSINTINFNSSEFTFDTLSLYKSKEIGAIDHLTKINNDIILFGECPIAGECIITQYSMDIGQSKLLRTGRLPSYISNHNKLFFYDKASDGNNWLFLTSLKNTNSVIKVAKEPKLKTLPNGIKQSITMPVIQISSTDIVFVGEDEQLWQYNIVDSKLTSTDVKDCRPVLWREKYNQLLCLNWKSWSPFLLDLKTKRKVDISELKGAYGFTYIPSNDALIYGKTRSKFIINEAYDIFLYSFVDKKEKRLIKDSHIAAGVWFESE